MKLIVISHPSWIENENEAMYILFENGLEYFHLRKPNANINDYRMFIEKINPAFHKYIIIHNHFELINEFKIKGVHLNSKAKANFSIIPKHRTFSCHSFKEIIEHKAFYDYLFLSPIFKSISKQNYQGAFYSKDLKEASEKKIIDDKVIALGGIDTTNFTQVKQWKFGGIGVLGFLWENYALSKDTHKLLLNFKLLQQGLKNQ
ncbi:MAG: thiamine phosphate synthase [Bacteroidales bacterium]|mgnify:CR=1 FL=1|nr:thiamine phosphate synthase [Bacteroidales bacterium]